MTITERRSASPVPRLSGARRPGAGAWLALLPLRLLALLPLGVSRGFGVLLGEFIFYANAKRRRIARINLELCFPEQTATHRARLLRRHFRLMGQSYVDIAFLVWASERRFRRKMRVRGLEHLHAARRRGRRVILLAPHCLGMNVGGIVLSRHERVFSMFKPQRSPLLNWLLERARSRYGAPLIARERGLRPVLRGLDEDVVFYYLPDEDFGPQRSVFTPFFGVPTATLPTLGRLAERAKADVIPCFTRLLPRGRGYEIILHPALAEFPAGERVRDAAHMNAALERGIREMPEQYMWTFRLFNTRPSGAPSPYA